MAQYLPLPDGSFVTVREGEQPADAWERAQREYPAAFGIDPKQAAPAGPAPEGGFVPAFKAGAQRLIGQGALTAGKVGLLDTAEAERINAEREARARQIFQPTDKPFLEAPLQNVAELAGGSAPYMLAPLAVGAGAALGGAPAAVGLGAAGLTSFGQFVGSNLGRQVDEGKSLDQASGTQAVAAAIPQAALDMVGFRFIPGIGRLFGAAGQRITAETAQQLASQTVRQVAADYVQAAGKAATVEGLTEAVQQSLERAQAELALLDPEARKEYLDSFIGGAVLGGTLGAPGRGFERSRMKRESEDLQAEQARVAAEQEAQRAQQAEQARAAEQQRLEQGFLEAERAAPSAIMPDTEMGPGTPQASLPGMEGTPGPDADTYAAQRSARAQQLAALETRTPEQERELQALTAPAESPAQRAAFLRAQIPQLDARMDEIRQANLSGATLAQRTLRERQMEQLRQARARAEQELQALNVPDAGSVAKEVAKLQKQLQAADEAGDTAKALRLAQRIEELGGAQTSLPLGPTRQLTDPAENARLAQDAADQQRLQGELGQRQEDMRAQRVGPADDTMDLFSQSMEDVETLRREGETNFDYLDPLFEKAFEGQPAAVAVPESVQPTPNAARMLARLDALEKTAGGDPRKEETKQAQTEILRLTSDDGTPFMQELRKARVGQSQALMELQSTLDDIRSGIYLGAAPRTRTVRKPDGTTEEVIEETGSLGTTTRAGLNKRAEEAKQRYISAMLQEAALRRRAQGAPALTSDEALRAADAANTALEELLTRGQAMPAAAGLRFDQRAPQLSREAANLKYAVDTAARRLQRAQQALATMAENTRGMTSPEAIRRAERLQAQAEKDVAARMLDLQQARDRFAKARKTLVQGSEQVTKGDIRDLEERPFGRYRAALGTILEQLDGVRAGLNTPAKGRATAERPLLRTQFAQTEAQRVAEASGETAKTPGGRDRREQEYVEGLLDRLEQRGQNVEPLRDRLAQSPTREVRAAVRDIALARLDGRAPSPQERRALEEAVKTARAAAPDQPGQQELFGTEDKAFTRATPANFQRALDRAPEVLKARKALQDAKQALATVQKPATGTVVRPARIAVLRGDSSATVQVPGRSSDPEIQRAMQSVQKQRDRLAKAMTAARKEALEADQKARDAVYPPAIKAAQQRLADAREELAKWTTWPYAQADGTPTKPELVTSLQTEIAETQARLDALQQDAVARADSTMNSYAFAQDSVVQFEKALLADMEKALETAINSNPDIARQRALSQAAAEQRQRVAVEEKRARDIADAQAKQRKEFEQRLRSGDGLPTVRSSERTDNRRLKLRYDALAQALDTPDPEIAATQAKIAELEAQENKDVAARNRLSRARKKLEQVLDREGARKEQLEQLEQQRREVMARMRSTEYLTQQERDERAAIEKLERERGTALDALKAQPFTPKQRSTTPAFREGRPGEPRKLRTGSAESQAGMNAPKPAGVGIKESTRPPVSRREVPASDMQEANRIAAEIKRQTPEQRAQEAREAAAVAKELAKSTKAAKPSGRAKTSRTIAEMEVDDTYDSMDLFDLARGSDDALFREDNAFYESRATTDLSENAAEAAFDGRILDVVDDIAQTSKNPVHRRVAQALRPMLLRTKLNVQDGPVIHDGKAAEGIYLPGRNTIEISALAMSEETFLHEAVHAATLRALSGQVQLSPAQQQALADLQALYETMKQDPAFSREYAGKNLAEFVSEVMSNQQVRDKIDAAQGRGFLDRLYNGILRLLGIRASDKAVNDALALFTPSRSFNYQYSGVASVMRGVFPATKPAFTGVPEDVRALSGKIVGRNPTLRDKIMANVNGLAFRTQFLDRFAPVDVLLEKGVQRGMISDAQALQISYFLRFGEQRNQFVEQAATTGVPQLRKNKDGEHMIETPDGDHPNLAKIAQVLSKAGVGNEQATEELFTTYLAVKRGEQVGFNKLNYDGAVTPADAAKINAFVNANPAAKAAFEEARKLYRAYNNDLLDLLVQTGAMTKSKAAELKQGDYVPYYRQDANGVVNLIVAGEQPIRIGNIKDQPYLEELVGGNEKILPFFSGAMQNTSLLIDMALRNKQMMEVAALLKNLGLARPLPGAGTRGRNVLQYTINGDPVHMVLTDAVDAFGVPADLLVKGMEGIKTTLPVALRLLQYPTNILRTFITRSPAYAIRQLVREPINAWLVSGANFTPVVSSVAALKDVLTNKSAAATALERTGAISSNVFTGDIQDQARIMRDVQAGKTPWQKVMAAADKMAVGSDTATRAVLYDKYRKQGMTHMQSVMATLETMNFSRRGLSPTMQMMSMLVPFFNAQVQGIDVIYRSLTGNSPMEKRLDVQRKLFVRGLGITAATLAYAALMQDDEAYKNATPEQRALNWFLPLPGFDEPLRVPIPFELGYLFKALPELALNTAFGDTEAGDAAKTIGRLAWQTVPIGIPQALKPALEVATNYSFFTGSGVETARERGMQTEARMRDNTTELSKMLGSAGVLSPVQIDYLIRGYTGGLGLTLVGLASNPLKLLQSADMPEMPTKNTSQLPFIGALFQPVDGRAAIDAAYEDIQSWQQAHNTFQSLVQQGRRAEAMQFAQRFSNELALNSTGGAFRQQMGELAALRRAVVARTDLTPAQKREQVDRIRQVELALARRIRELNARAS